MHKIISHCIVAGKIEEKKALPSRIGRIIKYYIWNLCKAESRLRSSDTPSLSQGLVYCWPDSSACHTYLPLCAAPVEATGDTDKKCQKLKQNQLFRPVKLLNSLPEISEFMESTMILSQLSPRLVYFVYPTSKFVSGLQSMQQNGDRVKLPLVCFESKRDAAVVEQHKQWMRARAWLRLSQINNPSCAAVFWPYIYLTLFSSARRA